MHYAIFHAHKSSNFFLFYGKLLISILNCSVDRNKYQIQIPLPPKIDPSVTMMTVEEKPDVTYNDVGGCKEQIEKMREVCNNMLVIQLLFVVSSFILCKFLS